MRRLSRRARTWFALAVVLAIVGLVILDGSASGIALAAAAIAAFVGVLRVLSGVDPSALPRGGGEGGGFG